MHGSHCKHAAGLPRCKPAKHRLAQGGKPDVELRAVGKGNLSVRRAPEELLELPAACLVQAPASEEGRVCPADVFGHETQGRD